MQLLEGSATSSSTEAAVHAADALSSLCHGGSLDGAAAVTAAGGVAVLARRFAECTSSGDAALAHACLRSLASLVPFHHVCSIENTKDAAAFACLTDVGGMVRRLVATLREAGCPVPVGNAAARVLAECIISTRQVPTYCSCAIGALVTAVEARCCGVGSAPLVIALCQIIVTDVAAVELAPSLGVVACLTSFAGVAADCWLRGGRGDHSTLSDAAFFMADVLQLLDADSAHTAHCSLHALRVLVAEVLHPDTTAERFEHTAELLMTLPFQDRLSRLFHDEGLLADLVDRVVGYLAKAPHTPLGRARYVLWLLGNALSYQRAQSWKRVRSVTSDALVQALARFLTLAVGRCTTSTDWSAMGYAAGTIAPAYVRLTDQHQPGIAHTLFGVLRSAAPTVSADAAEVDMDDGKIIGCTVYECLCSLEPFFEEPELELLPGEVDFLRWCCDATATASSLWEFVLVERDGAHKAACLLRKHGHTNPSSAAVSLAPVLLWVLDQTQTGSRVVREACTLPLACMVQDLTALGAPQLARLAACSSAAHICSNALRIASACVDASLSDLCGLAVRFEPMPVTCEKAAWLSRPDHGALLQRLRCCEAWLGTLVNVAAGDNGWADCLLHSVECLVTTVLDQFTPAAMKYAAMQKAALPGGATGPQRAAFVDEHLLPLTTSVGSCCTAAAFLVFNLARARDGSQAHRDALRTPALVACLTAWKAAGDSDTEHLPEGHWQRAVPEHHPACYRADLALRRLKDPTLRFRVASIASRPVE